MNYNNAYAAYRDTNVKTASQGKLIVLLYEGAIKNLRAAQSCFNSENKVEPRDIEKFGNFIMKTQDIINELQVSLDMDKGGQISQNLMSLYVYFNQELMTANINKDKQKIEFVLNMLTQLNEAWVTASNSQANAPAQPVQRTLNIQG